MSAFAGRVVGVTGQHACRGLVDATCAPLMLAAIRDKH